MPLCIQILMDSSFDVLIFNLSIFSKNLTLVCKDTNNFNMLMRKILKYCFSQALWKDFPCEGREELISLPPKTHRINMCMN